MKTETASSVLTDPGSPFRDDELRGVQAGAALAYEWFALDDRLLWGEAASVFFGPSMARTLSTGDAYDALVLPGSGLSRSAIARDLLAARDTAEMVRFELRYAIGPAGPDAQPLQLVDCGACLFDAAGRLDRVIGSIRVVEPDDGTEIAGGTSALAGVDIGRQALSAQVEQWLQRARENGATFAFVLIGIDHLSRLNDAYGFDIVDHVIEVIRRRLRARLRDGEAMGRFSVGKFGILLRFESEAELAERVRDLTAAVNESPQRMDGATLAAAVSAGAVTVPRQADDLKQIFTHAYDSLHRARHANRGGFEIYSRKLDRTAERRANLRFVDEIVAALDEGRVNLALQPIARADDRSIAFQEALVRVHGRDGSVSDGAAVIPPAERFGLTSMIDRRTLDLAFNLLRADPQARLSVNAAPTTLEDGGWIESMNAHAREGLCARMTVEITESARIVDIEQVRSSIVWLHDLGCKVAIDDFGVGYTSFRSLRRLGVDILKIDGSFVASLMASDADRHFVRALIDLAGNLGIETVAEWVLDEETAGQLAAWGCTYLQGQLIGLAQLQPVRSSCACGH